MQILGRALINIDTDKNIDLQDWQKAIPVAANELQDKDFFNFYSFAGKQTKKEEVMNILTLSNGNIPINRKKLYRVLNKSVYGILNTLLSEGILKESRDGYLNLQSKLLSAAISFYLKSPAQAIILQKTKDNLEKIKKL